MSKQMLKWTVEFEVHHDWIADGFDLTNERAKSMIEATLPLSYGPETTAKVISAPDPRIIRKLQGYVY